MFAGTAIGMGMIAGDPPDPNFMVIAEPTIATVSPLVPGETLTQAQADLLNAWAANTAAVIGIERAMITSVNRAQGAFKAGDVFWQIKQLQTAQLYARELAGELDLQPQLLEGLHAELVAAEFSVDITPADVVRFQRQVALGGLPASVVQALTELGADQALIDDARQLIIKQDPRTVAGNVPDILVSPELFDALRHLASVLSEVNPVFGDLNGDGTADCSDLAIVRASFGKRRGQPGFDSSADIDHNGVVGVRDVAFVARQLPAGTRCPVIPHFPPIHE